MDAPISPAPSSATISAMCRHGGSFVKSLGHAFAHADSDNFRKLREAFPEYWETYRKIGEELQDADVLLAQRGQLEAPG